MIMKITFLDAATLGEDIKDIIYDKFGVFGEVTLLNTAAPTDVLKAAADSDVLVVNKIKINSETLGANPKASLVCVAATGFDNIDLEYCKNRKIAVCNVRGYSTYSVAQITVAAVLSLTCKMPQYNEYVKSSRYTESGIANRLVPVYHELFGKVWGIVGAGNIGRQVAKIAEALGCRVIVCKRTPVSDMECVNIDTLCKTADIISVHTPLTDETRGLISRERIALMKKDAIFVNVARGAIADEQALTEAIEQNRLGGLGIDVYSKEPLPKEHPYNRILNNPNTCFTPHNAWGAYEARVRCLDIIAKNISSYLNGSTDNRVDI